MLFSKTNDTIGGVGQANAKLGGDRGVVVDVLGAAGFSTVSVKAFSGSLSRGRRSARAAF